MEIRRAGPDDIQGLARLLWLHASIEEQAVQAVEAFAVELAAWWHARMDSHLAFVAVSAQTEPIGMAWLAFLARTPRPSTSDRQSADIQSVFVIPKHRGQGIGSALVQTATEHAFHSGAGRVTVNSGRRAVRIYERLGFSSSPQLLERLPRAGTDQSRGFLFHS